LSNFRLSAVKNCGAIDGRSPGASLPADMPTQAADRVCLPAAHGRVSLVLGKRGGIDHGSGDTRADRTACLCAVWQAEGQPDGRHEEHWYRAAREIAAAESTNAAMKRTTRRKRRKK